VLLWCLPVCLAMFLESRLLKVALMLAERWRSKQAETGTWDRLKIKSVAVARTTTAKTAGMVSVVSSAATSSTTATSGGSSITSSETSQIQVSIAAGSTECSMDRTDSARLERKSRHPLSAGLSLSQLSASKGLSGSSLSTRRLSATRDTSSATNQKAGQAEWLEWQVTAGGGEIHATFGHGPIGIELTQINDSVRVTSVDMLSQASKQGILVGSTILEVGRRSVVGLDKAAVLEALKHAERPVTLVFESPTSSAVERAQLRT